MSELCRFWGLLIKLQYRDHLPPHIHVWHSGQDCALVSINPVKIIDGSLPHPQLATVFAWIYHHQQELLRAWDRAYQGLPPGRIAPLRSTKKTARR